MLVGVFHPSCIHPLHTVEVDQCTQHGFHRRAAPFAEQARVVSVFVKFLVHGIVERLVDAVLYLLELSYPAAALDTQRTVPAVFLAAAVAFLAVTLGVGQNSFKN